MGDRVLNKPKSFFPPNVPIIIVVFGWYPFDGNETSGWRAKPPLDDRINGAMRLAPQFKDAKILPVGSTLDLANAESPWIKGEMIRRAKNFPTIEASFSNRFAVYDKARDTVGNADFITSYIKEKV